MLKSIQAGVFYGWWVVAVVALVGLHVGGIVGPPVAGWFFDTSVDYRAVWVAISVISLAAACLVLVSRRHRSETVILWSVLVRSNEQEGERWNIRQP